MGERVKGSRRRINRVTKQASRAPPPPPPAPPAGATTSFVHGVLCPIGCSKDAPFFVRSEDATAETGSVPVDSFGPRERPTLGPTHRAPSGRHKADAVSVVIRRQSYVGKCTRRTGASPPAQPLEWPNCLPAAFEASCFLPPSAFSCIVHLMPGDLRRWTPCGSPSWSER